MHPHDAQERKFSKHPGSKQHKGGRSLRQRKRDRHLRRRATLAARLATEHDVTREF